jgi:hypothetical protein
MTGRSPTIGRPSPLGKVCEKNPWLQLQRGGASYSNFRYERPNPAAQ